MSCLFILTKLLQEEWVNSGLDGVANRESVWVDVNIHKTDE